MQPAFPVVSAVFANAGWFFLVRLLVECDRDVIEALAERVSAYCQHLPPEERTFYLLAAGHSKVSWGWRLQLRSSRFELFAISTLLLLTRFFRTDAKVKNQ